MYLLNLDKDGNKIMESKKFRDNRGIRDMRYEGELIVPCDDRRAVSKEEALSKIKNILENDKKLSEDVIADHKKRIKLIEHRLKEF